MASNQNKHLEARNEYVFKRKSAPSVAAVVGVSTGTVQRWKKRAKENGDDWDVARGAHLIGDQGLESAISYFIHEFVLYAETTMTALKAEKDMSIEARTKHLTMLADAMTKATSSAGKLAPKVSELGVAQDVLKRLLEFVRTDFPNRADAIQEVLEPFGEELARAYS